MSAFACFRFCLFCFVLILLFYLFVCSHVYLFIFIATGFEGLVYFCFVFGLGFFVFVCC